MVFHDSGFLEVLFKALGFQTHAKESGHVLESALLVCGAVSAVHIMNREEQAKGASLQASHGRRIGVDSLGYLSLKGMLESMPIPGNKFCTACFTGKYPLSIKRKISKYEFEVKKY